MAAWRFAVRFAYVGSCRDWNDKRETVWVEQGWYCRSRQRTLDVLAGSGRAISGRSFSDLVLVRAAALTISTSDIGIYRKAARCESEQQNEEKEKSSD